MKNSYITSVLCFAFCAFLFSCKKNITEPDTGIDSSVSQTFDNSEMIPATITGFIINEANEPVSGAQVRIGNAIYTTDEYGYFYFINASTPVKATLISVTKFGYFDGHRTIIPIKFEDNQVRIKLLSKGIPIVFNATDGGNLVLEGGVKITFPENAIVYKGTTTLYTGKVTMHHKYIDPTRDDLDEVVPGSLRGVNNGGGDVLLKTFGMEVIELYDDMDQALQLADNSSATITMPVPSALLNEAAQTIPLWSLNTENGMWIEEGAATLKNGKYVSEIPHFSYWNWDKPVEGIIVEGIVHNQNGVPVAGVLVEGTGSVPVYGKFKFSSFTNSKGAYKIKLPTNTNVTLTLDLDQCIGNMYSKSIQTSSTNMDVGLQIFNISNSTLFQCVLKDCNSKILKGSALELILGNRTYSFVSDAFGQIKVVLPCYSYSGGVKLFTHNPDTDKYGLLDTTLIPGQLNNLGDIYACGYDYQYLTGTRGELVGMCWFSKSVDWVTPTYVIDQSYNGQNIFVCKDQSGNDSLKIQFSGPQGLGAHTITSAEVRGDVISNPVGSINIIEYGPAGRYLKGSLVFEYTPSSTYLTRYNLDFYVIRRQ